MRGAEDGPGEEAPEDENFPSEMLRERIETLQPDLSLTTELIMTGQFGALAKLLLSRSRDVGLERMESPLQANFFLRRFRLELDLDQVMAQANQFLSGSGGQGLSSGQAQAMEEYVAENVSRVEEEVRRLVRQELDQNRYLYLRRLQEEDQTEKRLAGLTDDEILAMRPAVERLARRIKERLSLRLKHAEHGRLDLKLTIRDNVGYGGVLPYLRFRKKKPARPQVMALCDVSNSVRNFSRFMLLFLYTLREVIARVRSFIFVGDLAEVTALFAKHELNDAVSQAASGRGLVYPFRTDYGSSLSQFRDEHLSSVTSKTTVFILGDARNNFYDPRTEALEAIAEKARRLIWLNPEPRLNWRLGDSAMEAYQPYCTTVVECGNLRQLSEIIEENLLP